ncbi:hypothetical protein [Arthrobacter caoxuetaonis]|uniref:Uncharacterized protein n=1 Tax=Arthrobacter caoxuetaonis TaxID=2886935 RepID=A0A9X1MGG6_9MICC|nr:hypothetical protein [Arthrobacter caoxuetaonis]MCC3299376.1 hypothetical protein [Arthrobacter caoxuetaonis]USQ59131.1 hypothetical protein NF551_18670 [Arthrobacter caoxuetaonis]
MKLNRIFKRKPAGVSDGGQFTIDQKAEPAVTLTSPDAEPHPYMLQDGDPTPYGSAMPYKIEAEGVQRFSTGYDDGDYVCLSEERNAMIPEEYRNENGFYADHGIYGRAKATELDVVMVTHPDAFHEDEVERARDLIAVRDAPQDIQEDLGEVQGRTSLARMKADRLREELKTLETAEKKWAASTLAAGTLEHFPGATKVSFLKYGDDQVGSIQVHSGDTMLGMMSAKLDGQVVGNGSEDGKKFLHTAMSTLEDVPDSWLHEQGATTSGLDASGERVISIDVNTALNKAAERIRDADPRRW